MKVQIAKKVDQKASDDRVSHFGFRVLRGLEVHFEAVLTREAARMEKPVYDAALEVPRSAVRALARVFTDIWQILLRLANVWEIVEIHDFSLIW